MHCSVVNYCLQCFPHLLNLVEVNHYGTNLILCYESFKNMPLSSRSPSNHFLTRFSAMILSLEPPLNINHLMTNDIKSLLCIVSTLETKWDMLGCPTLWKTILFISWKMKMIHESEVKRHHGIINDISKPLWTHDIIKDLCWAIYHITIGSLHFQSTEAWCYVKSYSSFTFSFVTFNLV